ncbi:MAG: hypothetical protein WBB19_08125 [Desulforhopalus sp.]
MIRRAFIIILLFLFILSFCSYAESSGDAPLQLLNPDQKNDKISKNQVIGNKNEFLRDIRGPVPLKEQPPYLLIAGGVVLALLLLAALYWYLKKRGVPTLPVIPPWEQALLDLARARKLLSAERGLLYMDRVSQILRKYIESRFAIRSTRQTTREFLQSLTEVGGSSPLQTYKAELQNCLEQADMAKFAHHLSERASLEEMEVAVTTFIERTKPVEPPKSANPLKPSKRSLRSKRAMRGRS